MTMSQSGINLRSQVKPSVLQIHRFRDNSVFEINPREGEGKRLLSADKSYPYDNKTDDGSLEVSRCPYPGSLQCRSPFYSRITFRPLSLSAGGTTSTFTIKSESFTYFCEWKFELFGVDEDKIPSEEEEEFGEVDEEAEEELAKLQRAPGKKPRYGRRARPKPILTREDGREFECICDIDDTFKRHHVPHFGGGILSKKDEWRVPHFSSYWEDYKDRLAEIADSSLLKLVESKTEQAQAEGKKREVHLPLLRSYGPNQKNNRRRILESLRPLSCKQLRRQRMPFSEAIILELQEEGFYETAEFLKRLIIEEYRMNREREKQLTLRENKQKLLKLVKLLTAAEKKGRKQEYNNKSTILLKTGKHFSDSGPDWWWLAERLFEKAIEAGSKYVVDGGKSKAIAHYIYGVFLVDCAKKVRPAQEHLNKARELSSGRDWKASRIIEKAQEPIHSECSNHLCRALIETSKQLRKEGKPEEALRFIHQSYKLCQELHTSTRPDIELDTLFELGATYQDAGEVEWAKVAFKKFIAKANMEGNHRNICDGHLELAICFRMEGEINHCQYHLQSYLNYAKANHDENLKAFGNRYLGELHLNHGYPQEAVFYFKEAFKSFLNQYEKMKGKPWKERLQEELTLPQDIEMTRVLTGLAIGEILTKPICRLILRAREVRNQKDTLKLLKWKNEQEVLFDLTESEPKKVRKHVSAATLTSTESVISRESAATENEEA